MAEPKWDLTRWISYLHNAATALKANPGDKEAQDAVDEANSHIRSLNSGANQQDMNAAETSPPEQNSGFLNTVAGVGDAVINPVKGALQTLQGPEGQPVGDIQQVETQDPRKTLGEMGQAASAIPGAAMDMVTRPFDSGLSGRERMEAGTNLAMLASPMLPKGIKALGPMPLGEAATAAPAALGDAGASVGRGVGNVLSAVAQPKKTLVGFADRLKGGANRLPDMTTEAKRFSPGTDLTLPPPSTTPSPLPPEQVGNLWSRSEAPINIQTPTAAVEPPPPSSEFAIPEPPRIQRGSDLIESAPPPSNQPTISPQRPDISPFGPTTSPKWDMTKPPVGFQSVSDIPGKQSVKDLRAPISPARPDVSPFGIHEDPSMQAVRGAEASQTGMPGEVAGLQTTPEFGGAGDLPLPPPRAGITSNPIPDRGTPSPAQLEARNASPISTPPEPTQVNGMGRPASEYSIPEPPKRGGTQGQAPPAPQAPAAPKTLSEAITSQRDLTKQGKPGEGAKVLRKAVSEQKAAPPENSNPFAPNAQDAAAQEIELAARESALIKRGFSPADAKDGAQSGTKVLRTDLEAEYKAKNIPLPSWLTGGKKWV